MQKYYLKFHTALVILNIASVTSEADLLPHISKSAVRFSSPHHPRNSRNTRSSKARNPFSTLSGPSSANTTTKARSKRPTRKSFLSSWSFSPFSLTMQSVLGGIRIEDMSMMFESDSVPLLLLPSPQIIQTSTRICRALVFYFSQRPSFPPDVREGDLLLWVLSLLRALQRRTWGDGSRALLQLVPFSPFIHSSIRTAWVPRRCTTSPSAASAICAAWPRRPRRW